MKIDIYDPAMCCSTGVCGPEVDPQLVQFAADVKWLSTRGVEVQRHNLGQEPGAFMSDALVRRTLQSEGVGCLPLGVVESAIVFRGGYPARPELMRLLSVEAEVV
ncbi:MAG: arsenite efflux transporter metallochaperone ArsD [Gemmatimonadota bacterium]